jgi:hypothetical protein
MIVIITQPPTSYPSDVPSYVDSSDSSSSANTNLIIVVVVVVVGGGGIFLALLYYYFFRYNSHSIENKPVANGGNDNNHVNACVKPGNQIFKPTDMNETYL